MIVEPIVRIMKKSPGRTLEKIVTLRGRRFLLRVEDSVAPADYLKYEELRNTVWQYPQDNLPGGRNMMCENFLSDGSSLFIGAFAEDERGAFTLSAEKLVGFSFGFVGLKDKALGFRTPGNLQFYSQYNAVRQEYRGWHLGILIKEFQREVVRDVFGLATITCTYDPLTAVNAHRNIHHFGMEVLAYRTDIYGEFGGLLNRLDVPRDRLFVSWDLEREIRRPECDLRTWVGPERLVIETGRAEVSGRSGPVELDVIQGVRTALEEETLLIEIPADFYLMLWETDVEDEGVRRIPVEWRMKTREAFLSLFAKSYRVTDFCRLESAPQRQFYVLKKESPPRY
jgi:predicted GNAT superfamily acetyltransferase